MWLGALRIYRCPRLQYYGEVGQMTSRSIMEGCRNEALFDTLRHFAYDLDEGRDEATWGVRVLSHAMQLSSSMPVPEDARSSTRTAASVARFCWLNPDFGRHGESYDHSADRQRRRAYIGIKKKRALLLPRNREIKDLRTRGWPVKLIADHAGLKPRQVSNILRRWREIEANAAKLQELSRQTGTRDQGDSGTPAICNEPISSPPKGGGRSRFKYQDRTKGSGGCRGACECADKNRESATLGCQKSSRRQRGCGQMGSRSTG